MFSSIYLTKGINLISNLKPSIDRHEEGFPREIAYFIYILISLPIYVDQDNDQGKCNTDTGLNSNRFTKNDPRHNRKRNHAYALSDQSSLPSSPEVGINQFSILDK